MEDILTEAGQLIHIETGLDWLESEAVSPSGFLFILNGISVDIVAPLSIEDVVLETFQRTETGMLRLARQGDTLRALRVPIQTDYLTSAEKDTLEAEILAPGAATVGGDLFGASFPAYLIPTALVPGPLSDMWTWYFEVQEIG